MSNHKIVFLSRVVLTLAFRKWDIYCIPLLKCQITTNKLGLKFCVWIKKTMLVIKTKVASFKFLKVSIFLQFAAYVSKFTSPQHTKWVMFVTSSPGL